MKRFVATTAALTIAATAMATTTAGADPVFTMRSSGAPIEQGDTGRDGQPVEYLVSGCSQPGGGSAYFGQFVQRTDIPDAPIERFEAQTASNGTFSAEATIEVPNGSLDLELHWYCSYTPVTSMADPNIVWLSPTFDYSIQGADVAPAMARQSAKGARTVTLATTAARSGDGSAIAVTVDPNALPRVDKMGITGPKVAALKAKVDARAKATNTFENWVRRLFKVPAAPVTNADYVKAIYQVTHGTVPSGKVRAAAVKRLDDGQLRATVLEDIALTKKSAAVWNR